MTKLKHKDVFKGNNVHKAHKSSIKKRTKDKMKLRGSSDERAKDVKNDFRLTKNTVSQSLKKGGNDLKNERNSSVDDILVAGVEANSDSCNLGDKEATDHLTVFVGNLPQNVKKLQLNKLFGQFGTVKSIRLRTSDGKKLFKNKSRKETQALNAYVVFTEMKSVERAIQMSGLEFKGHHIRITRAKKCFENVDSKRTIFVGNLKYCATDEKLFNIFSSCGEIEYVRTLQSSKGCKGVAYVCFRKPDSVSLALDLNDTVLDERPIRVERYSRGKLGAHEKRKEEERPLSGASRRIKEKNRKAGKGDDIYKESKKKSKFRGQQVNSKKKYQKQEKMTEMKKLAKKIAPKI